MKKFATSFVATSLVLGGLSSALLPVAVHAATTATATATTNGITVIVEDKEIGFDVSPQIIHDRTFVPLRSLAETLGATVDYNSNTRVATITKDDIVLVLDFNTGIVTKNGTVVPMDAPPQIINNRTLVPLRFISQAFGNDVTYDAATHTASVLASQKTLDRCAQIKDVLTAAQTAQNNMTSFEMTGTMETDLFDNHNQPTGSITDNLVSDFNRSPFAGHLQQALTVTIQGQANTVNAETYLANGKEYDYDPMSHTWTYKSFDMAALPQMDGMTTTSDTNSAAFNAELPYTTMTEDSNNDTVVTDLDQNGLKKLISVANQETDNTIDVNGMKNDTELVITQTIDKNTHLLSNVKIVTTIQPQVMDAPPFTMTLNFAISKYNSVPTITVPQDVIDSAVPAQNQSTGGNTLMSGL